jgi:hypothetical protein
VAGSRCNDFPSCTRTWTGRAEQPCECPICADSNDNREGGPGRKHGRDGKDGPRGKNGLGGRSTAGGNLRLGGRSRN